MNIKDGFFEGHFYFDPDDPIYADHFPGNPVVPGSLIVHAFLTAVSGLACDVNPRRIQNFRFKRFIPPGRYRYRIQKRAAHCDLACQLYAGQTLVVTGSLIGDRSQ